MSTQYRVDRAHSPVTPVGMNSILYLGNNWGEARATFHAAEAGYNNWNTRVEGYGVILSVWDDAKQQYVVKCQKGIE